MKKHMRVLVVVIFFGALFYAVMGNDGFLLWLAGVMLAVVLTLAKNGIMEVR